MSSKNAEFGTFSDTVIETFMADIGISWTVHTVPVSSVDLKDSTFQTRLNTAHYSAVAREYADKMKAGDRFPMIVLQRKSDDLYRVVCGRHRAAAYAMAQNGKAAYMAYIVDDATPADLLMALSARDNNANGVRQGNGETARVAADYITTLPLAAGSRCHNKMTIKEVSQRFGAHVSTVTGHYHAKLVAVEIIRAGCDASGITVKALQALWTWIDNRSWIEIAKAVCANASMPNLADIIYSASREKLNADALISRIRQAALKPDGVEAVRPKKDPGFVTLEHISLAVQDLRSLAPPSNLPAELAEDISSMVETLRMTCKEWKRK